MQNISQWPSSGSSRLVCTEGKLRRDLERILGTGARAKWRTTRSHDKSSRIGIRENCRLAIDSAGQALKEGAKYLKDAKRTRRSPKEARRRDPAWKRSSEKSSRSSARTPTSLLAEKGTLGAALDEAKARLPSFAKPRKPRMRARSLQDLPQVKEDDRRGTAECVLCARAASSSPSRTTCSFPIPEKRKIKPEGQKAVKQLSKVLATLKDRQFQIRGPYGQRADSIPSRFRRIGSCSTARAVEVRTLLTAEGCRRKPSRPRGMGEFDPVAVNDTGENRSKNRRNRNRLKLMASYSRRDSDKHRRFRL